MEVTLTADQQEAYDKLQKFIGEGQEGLFVLMGFAGTGKTFLTTQLIQWVKARPKFLKVAMTAPTNKAVKVLRDFGGKNGAGIDYSTLHSLLGLTEKIDSQGNQKFERKKNAPGSPIKMVDLIIVDESSMVSDELFDFLMEEAHRLKIIFIGDPAQIPPIGKENSIPLTEQYRKEYGMQEATLTKIVRQAEGNPLIEYTMKIRKNLEDTVPVRQFRNHIVDGNGLEFIDAREYVAGGRKLFYGLLKYYFVNEKFKENADFVKVIAWTNNKVNDVNKVIRAMIYGDEIDKVELGEKLIADKPIFFGEDIIFNTSDDFEVINYEIKMEVVMGEELKYYDTQVKYYNVFYGEYQNKNVHIIHEESEKVYKYLCDQLKSKAISFQNTDRGMAANAWKGFFQLTRVFAEVKYNYAITAHKAQGSTYGTVLMVESDMNKNRKIVERNRIKYTAATRPSKKLYVISL